MAAKLDGIARFSEITGYDLGAIIRKPITKYGSFNLNPAVCFIQSKIAAKPEIGNLFVEIDALAPDAIARFLPRATTRTGEGKKETPRKRKRTTTYSKDLGLVFEALISRPYCTVVDALRLAKSGFYVFSLHSTVRDGFCSCRWGRLCKKAGKHPCSAHWQQRATRFEDSIIRMWEQHPYANVGIACGKRLPDGEFLTVLDCDWRHNGDGSIMHLEKNELCPLPLTLEVNSGGGPHRYFSYRHSFSLGSGKMGCGIDVQSKDRFVVAAGMHARGTRYERIERPIARLPDDWARYIDATEKKTLPLIQHGARTKTLLSWAGGLVKSGANRDLALATLRDYRDRRVVDPQDFNETTLRDLVDYCKDQEGAKVQRAAA